MDKITKDIMSSISKTVQESVTVNQKRYITYNNVKPQGVAKWTFADRYKGLNEAVSVVFEGEYFECATKAREWGKSKGLNEVYLLETVSK